MKFADFLNESKKQPATGKIWLSAWKADHYLIKHDDNGFENTIGQLNPTGWQSLPPEEQANAKAVWGSFINSVKQTLEIGQE